MSYLDILKAQLIRHEGYKHKPYIDTVGKVTIAVGRNLTDRGVSDSEIYLMLDNDISLATVTAKALVPGFDSLTDNRKAVLANMAFNLGMSRFSQFTSTLAAVNNGRFDDAADFMLDSLWAKQVGNRAKELSELMRQG